MKNHWKSASAARPSSGVVTNGGARLSKPSAQTVRGRISNPIPLGEPTEDDEFPMRQPGTGIASAAVEDRKDTTDASNSNQSGEDEKVPTRAPAEEGEQQAPEETPAVLPQDKAPEPRSSPVQPRQSEHRTNPSSTIRQSMISSDTGRTKSSKGQHEKKKSGLRGALGKLFGRKKKTNSVLVSEQSLTPAGSANQHQSDPSALRRTSSKREAARSASVPITQYDRALRSHSVGPDDVLAVDDARNSLAVEGGLVRRRVGTASTHLVGVRPTRDNDWVGLTPRPASTHGARSTTQESAKVDPGEIGRAITSDFSGLKRRSRSLSFLANVPLDEDGGQRRSTELRYWRESYEPNIMSPISSNAEDAETAPMSMDLPRMNEEISVGTPPQPFQFGDLATMNELAGMRITDAVSMDSRIGSLEARMHRLESVVTQLCDATPNFKPRVEPPTRVAPAIPDETASAYTLSIAPLKMSAYPASGREMRTSTRPSTQQSQLSKTSFGDAHTFVDSMPPRPVGHQFVSGNAKERPISTATIRGATSLPSLIKDGHKPFTIDHYTTLMALIDTERSARQALEAQVKVMGHQMAIMSKTIRIRNGRTNSTASGIQTSSFDVDEDDEDELQATLARHQGPTGAPHERGTAHDDDDDEEPFTTPHEEVKTFDEQLRNEEDRKVSARTLSLSRLTLGAAPR
ncbi:hypothetical protein NLU13_3161 [Sarocladium strictum]|uniref:Uncharacterized protein n=1 Tax=Sarocladium strictum TaxID=5046 RepID=A0AA39GLT7_SARSR|nr:hypothetical protein NLU13_3161 [Sarocladium strictum]